MSESVSESLNTCDCCEQEPAVGVAAVPFVPLSIAWGRKCLEAHVVPYDIAVTLCAMIGGPGEGVEEWRGYVERTLAYFEKSTEQFAVDVQDQMEEMDRATGQH